MFEGFERISDSAAPYDIYTTKIEARGIRVAVIESNLKPESLAEWCRHHRDELLTLQPGTRAPRRQYAWLLSRILLWDILGTANITYQDDKKPYIVGRKEKISLSHSGNAAALWIGHDLPGGIDIQKSDKRLLRAGPYFLSQEQNQMVQLLASERDRLQLLLKSWTIKEAVLKASSQKSLNYIRNILFSSAEWKNASELTVLEVSSAGLYCRRLLHFCNDEYHLSFTV